MLSFFFSLILFDSSALGQPNFPECLAACQITFDNHTRVKELEEELLHDARFPLVMSITCNGTHPDVKEANVTYNFQQYEPKKPSESSAEFELHLRPWLRGLATLAMPRGCSSHWFLITMHPPAPLIDWKCRMPVDVGGGGEPCPETAALDAREALKIICRYELARSMDLLNQDKWDINVHKPAIQAKLSLIAGQEEQSRSNLMKCSDPDPFGVGACESCWHIEPSTLNEYHTTSIIVTNAFGSATAHQAFMVSNITHLEGKPNFHVAVPVDGKLPVEFHFYVNKGDQQQLCPTWSRVQYRVITRRALSTSLESLKELKVVCNICTASCGAEAASGARSSCSIRLHDLAPANRYAYNVSWRVFIDGTGAPWSSSVQGSVDIPESAPSSSPKLDGNSFQSLRGCSAACEDIWGAGDCREVVIYWKSIPPEERNGNLTGIRVQTELGVEHLPSRQQSYSLCSNASSTLRVLVTAETRAGAPAAGAWSSLTIPAASQLLPLASDVIARPNSELGVQLCWRYAEPADTFTIFWKSEDEPEAELSWIVVAAHLEHRHGIGKWSYFLPAEHLRNFRSPKNIQFGIGVSYRNMTSGLAFNPICRSYGDLGAPKVEILGSPGTSRTAAEVEVRLAAVSDACSFAGPLTGFEVKVVEDGTDYTEATCSNCQLDVALNLSVYQLPRVVRIGRLSPNRRYGFMLRSVVDSGVALIAGDYSLPTYAKTSGLTAAEAFGVATGAATFFALLGLMAAFLPRCHRAVGLGQKVRVPLIKPDSAPEEAQADEPGIKSGYRRPPVVAENESTHLLGTSAAAEFSNAMQPPAGSSPRVAAGHQQAGSPDVDFGLLRDVLSWTSPRSCAISAADSLTDGAVGDSDSTTGLPDIAAEILAAALSGGSHPRHHIVPATLSSGSQPLAPASDDREILLTAMKGDRAGTPAGEQRGGPARWRWAPLEREPAGDYVTATTGSEIGCRAPVERGSQRRESELCSLKATGDLDAMETCSEANPPPPALHASRAAASSGCSGYIQVSSLANE